METKLHNLFGKVMHQLLLVVHSPPPSLLQGTKKLCPPLKVAGKLLGICQDQGGIIFFTSWEPSISADYLARNSVIRGYY